MNADKPVFFHDPMIWVDCVLLLFKTGCLSRIQPMDPRGVGPAWPLQPAALRFSRGA